LEQEELITFIAQHDESEILDYKENLNDAQVIGEYISALGNSAILANNPMAYLIWGIHNLDKEIVGTSFDPYRDSVNKKNQMPLITFLETFLNPRIVLKWDVFHINGSKVVSLSIDVTGVNRPIKFKGKSFIRSGTSKKNIDEFPEKERQLWKAFESSKFELEYARSGLSWNQVKSVLDLNFFATTLDIHDEEVLKHSLLESKVIAETGNQFNLTNLGAYTLARNLTEFPYLQRKAIRVTRYRGNRNVDNAIMDRIGNVGIAVGFSNVIKVIMNSLPYKEEYHAGVREDRPAFPQIAIRELVANALVHQDFTVSGSRPFVEIYDGRVEISNPGTPLIAPERFLDYKPRSRNDELADILGKLRIVESRGTGIDKAVYALEEQDLPAMDISIQGVDTTVVKLTTKKPFKEMTITDKNHSIYWNACLRYVEGLTIDNASVRKRFRLDKNSSAQVSKALNAAMDAKLFKPYDKNAGRKFFSYIPFWGKSVQGD